MNVLPKYKNIYNFDASHPRPRVIIASPYRGNGETKEQIARDIAVNLAYARVAMRDSILRGEVPMASHLLYTQPGILDDSNRDERTLGIALGLLWFPVVNYIAFYTDLGWSPGMMEELTEVCRGIGFEYRLRSLLGKEAIKLPKGISDNTIFDLISNHCEE